MDYPGLPLVAINAGGGAYIDSTGTQYIADTYFTGGREYLGGQNRLLVTDAPPSGQTVTYDYSFTVVPHSGEFGECLLAYAGGLKKEGKETVWSLDQLSYTEIRTLRNASDQLVSKTATTWEKFPFGFRKVSEVLDPDGAALATTWDYIEGSENPADPKPAGYGEIKSMNRYDGYWEVYTYNGDGVLIKTVSRYLNSTTRSEADNKVETFAYSTSNPILTHVVSIQGQEVTRSYEAEFDDWNEFEHWTIIAVTPDALWDAPENLVSKTRTYHSSHPTEFLRGRIKWIQSPDGTMTFYSYSINGSNRTITRDVGAPNANKTAIVDGIRTITEINEVGQQVDEELVDIASGLTLSTITALEVDSLGRPTLIGYGDGTARSIIYAGSSASCGSCSGPGTWQIAQEIDRYGITTTYTYDALGRRIGTVRLGISEQIIYDAVDHVIQRTRIGSDGSETIREQVTFDMAGREATRKDALGNEITIIYAYPSEGGAVTTTTNPITAAGEGTRIETAYADGKLKEIGGTAVSPLRYVYGTWTTSGQAGEWTQEIKVGDNNAETEWIKTYSDLTGRQIKIEYPDGDGSYAALSYNTQGHLVGQTDPDGLTTLFAYNAKGKREVTAIDMNQDGVIDYAGADRITKTTNDVYSKSGTIVNRIITQVWATDNSNTPTTLSIVEQDAYGNESWQTNAAGAVTHNQTVLNGNGNWSVTMTSPDGSQQMQSYSNGRLAYSTQKASTGAQVTRTDYAYDAHNRVITQTDARTGPVTQTYSDRDEVLSVTSNNGTNTTSYTYDALGNRLTVTHPDNSVTINEYHLRNNLLKKIFGSQAYPIEYTYDLQGRMKTLTTWRNATTAAGAAVTTWNYDSQRGWLTQKLYADNTGPSYTYTPAGKLATRIWARTVNGSPLDTSYDYNNAGDLILIDYSDSTPDVTIAYNRFGAQATVTDATGLRTVTYNAALQLEQEKLPGFFGNRILTRSHEIAGTGSIPGREAGFLLGTISDLDSDHAVIYGYDNAGRLNTVTDLDATYTYGYLPNSNLRATITGPAHTVTYSYEPHRDVVTSIENKVGAVTVSKYDYTVNSLGQRTQRQQSGTAFTATSTDIFVYNGKGEVTDSSNTIFPDYNRNFIYDDIGNRTSFTNNTGTFSYTTNNLNQYSGIQSLGSQFIASDYDLDGNMTIVGTGFRYVWDAENRLVVVEPVAPFVGDKKQRNTYDSQGRRVRKEVLSYNGSTWSLNTDEKFIYDGWNLVAVLDATNSNALLRTHTWGLDLSGTLQGAGGVGGLLAVKERSGLYSSVKHFTLDVNGNVSEVLNDSGTVVAHYEYDVFGDTVVSSGAYKDNNLWRFNSKYLDNLGGIYYYGYRFYAPAIGRWLNRDIISERGGTNLYAMVSNGTINQYDILGMIRNWTYNSAISEVQGTISSWSSIYPFASRLMAHWLRENRKSQGLSMPILPYITSSNDENEVKQYGMSAIKAEINAEMDRVRVPNGGTLYFADRNVNYTFTGGNMGFSYGNVQLTIYASGILIGARQNNFGTISVPYEGDFIIKLDDTYAWRTDLRGILTSAWSATYDAASWLTQNCAYKQFSHSMSFQQHIKDIYIEMSSL
ncbi:hypothetical protein OPIT5_23640 [Opitutaceae bacterium TAV5]|nr:hypothetical protein OPIT5_23640 [Opitutaceae bacterium TAV5]